MYRGGRRPYSAAGSVAWRGGAAMVAAGLLTALAVRAGAADTVPGALVQAYKNNPQLNAQRAAARAVDESVAIALGGYRPRVTATASLTELRLETLTRVPATAAVPTGKAAAAGDLLAQNYALTATQTLFNGFQTGNRTRQAEAQVFAAARRCATPSRRSFSTPSRPT